jgi:hypothetical protein
MSIFLRSKDQIKVNIEYGNFFKLKLMSVVQK